jgi:myo-inositol-1(or 4)-monophosphatase
VAGPLERAELAERAALVGGDVVRSAAPDVEVERKGLPGDYVTEIDRRSEEAIVGFLARHAPDVPVLAEEAGGTLDELVWVVDPLDGTTNFVHRFRVVGVSVALLEAGRPVAGCVHAPFLGETYVGERGAGAWLRSPGVDRRLRVSDRPPPKAVVGTGFPFRRKDLLPRYLEVLRPALERFEDLRRPGSASLDLAWTAAGIFDGFFELRLSAWDVAAGALLIEEAGGRVTDWAGGPGYLSGDVLAGSPEVHAALLELVTGAPPG